jgi:hypothetical protein
MQIPKLEDILEVVKRVLFNEEYIKMFPIFLQEQIRHESRNYKGTNIECIFNIVAISVHKYLIKFNSGKVTDNEF